MVSSVFPPLETVSELFPSSQSRSVGAGVRRWPSVATINMTQVLLTLSISHHHQSLSGWAVQVKSLRQTYVPRACTTMCLMHYNNNSPGTVTTHIYSSERSYDYK